MNYREILSRHVASSTLKQRQLSDFFDQHGNPDWAVDMKAGTASFGGAGSFPLQVVGTQADGDNSWMWGWANIESGIAPQLLRVANQLKALGETEGIAELLEPTLPLREQLGHELALIATGVSGADAYYRGPYAGGALFFTLADLPLSNRPALSTFAEINLLAQVVSTHEVDHGLMVRSFFQSQDYPTETEGNQLRATRANGEQIVVTFDEQDRISNLETTIKGDDEARPALKKKPWWRFGM